MLRFRIESAYVSDALFVLDGYSFYRLRVEDDDPWVKFEPPGSNAQMTVAGVTHDGSHLIIGYHGNGPGYFRTAEVIQLIAYETDTGMAVGTLDITPQGHVDSRSADAGGHTQYSPLSGTTLKDIMMPEDGGRVLLYFDEHANLPQTPSIVAWNFLDKTIRPGQPWTTSDIGLNQLLFGYIPWSITSIDDFDDDFGRGYLGAALLSPSQRFQLWSEESRRADETIGSLPVTTYSLRSIRGNYPEPYDRYDPLTCALLYDLDSATSHTQPSRVLEFDHSHGQEQITVTLSRSGERGIVHVGANGPLLLVDIENAQALSHISYGIDGIIYGEFFANDGRQLIDLHLSPHPPFPAQQTSDRHELLIFDVP